MQLQIDKLGKVAITVEQGYWSNEKDYDRLTIVEAPKGEYKTYISRKPVPAGTVLTNREYWIPFSSLKEEIVIDFNEFVASLIEAMQQTKDYADNTIEQGIADITAIKEEAMRIITYIADNGIDSTVLAPNSVTSEKIKAGNVLSRHIGEREVKSANIGAGEVKSNNIGEGEVKSVNIGNGEVKSGNIGEGEVKEGHIAPGAITTDKLDTPVIEELQTIMDVNPTAGSVKPVQSGGVLYSIIKDGSAFDLSAHTGDSYTDLSAALTAMNALSAAYKKGGMSIKYIQSSDNNSSEYVQYRLMADEFSTDTDKWSFSGNDVYVENPEFVQVVTDSDEKVLYGVKPDGDFYFGAGVPSQIQNEVDTTAATKVDKVEGKGLSTEDYTTAEKGKLGALPTNADLTTALGLKANSADVYNKTAADELLVGKVDKVEGKGLSTNDYTDEEKEVANTSELIDNPEYLEVKTDSEGRPLTGIKSDGFVSDSIGHEVAGNRQYAEDNPEYSYVCLDKDGHVIWGIKKDGNVVFAAGVPDEMKQYVAQKVAEGNAAVLDGSVSVLEDYSNLFPFDKPVIEVGYLDQYNSSSEIDFEKVSPYLEEGEYGLLSWWYLVQKVNGEVVVAMIDGNIMNTVANLSKYLYKTKDGMKGDMRSFTYQLGAPSNSFSFSAAFFQPKAGFPLRTQNIELPYSENVVNDYDATEWDFTTDENGLYTLMSQVYAKMDALALAHPSLVTKYDPMTQSSYEDGGVTTYPLSAVRTSMASAGFSDYPVFAQGIEEAGEYTIGAYTVNLLQTPAYKTFIYKIADNGRNAFPTYARVPKRVVYLQAGIHAAEVISQISACLLAGELCADTDTAYQLLSRFEFWVIPCLEGYGGFHNTSINAYGVNPNRNFDTPWWYQNTENIEESGYAAGDNFSTRLSMCLIDYIKPDVAIDAHTLNSQINVKAPHNVIGEYGGRIGFLSAQLIEASTRTAFKINQKYSSILGDFYTKAVTGTRDLNDGRTLTYAYIHGCECTSLIECNNTIGGDNSTLNSSEAISQGVYFLKQLLFGLCKYNLANCLPRFR